MKPVYKVMVDDNFHFMDESERYQSGAFSSADEAIQKSKLIVNEYLSSAYKPGMGAEELYESYTGFGEDPFIIVENSDERVEFSAWDYAKQRCRVITEKGAGAS